MKKFNFGDLVSVRIPRIDRARTDTRRLPCIVVEKTGKSICFIASGVHKEYLNPAIREVN